MKIIGRRRAGRPVERHRRRVRLLTLHGHRRRGYDRRRWGADIGSREPADLVATLVGARSAGAIDNEQVPKGRPTEQAVSDGGFAPFSMPARVGGTQAFASGFSGYDSSRKGPLAEVAAEVHIWGPVALRGGAIYSNDTDRMRPSVGVRAQFLRQDSHRVDGSLGVFFKTEGFTETEGEIETFASVGRAFDKFTVVGNLVYGQDPEGNERDGEFRAAIFRQVGRLVLGIDSRARPAIGVQHGKAATMEPKFDAVGGPLAMVAIGPMVVIGEVGPSAVKMPNVGTRAGVAAFGGVGSAF
jgi:hypothetical protein